MCVCVRACVCEPNKVIYQGRVYLSCPSLTSQCRGALRSSEGRRSVVDAACQLCDSIVAAAVWVDGRGRVGGWPALSGNKGAGRGLCAQKGWLRGLSSTSGSAYLFRGTNPHADPRRFIVTVSSVFRVCIRCVGMCGCVCACVLETKGFKCPLKSLPRP